MDLASFSPDDRSIIKAERAFQQFCTLTAWICIDYIWTLSRCIRLIQKHNCWHKVIDRSCTIPSGYGYRSQEHRLLLRPHTRSMSRYNNTKEIQIAYGLLSTAMCCFKCSLPICEIDLRLLSIFMILISKSCLSGLNCS